MDEQIKCKELQARIKLLENENQQLKQIAQSQSEALSNDIAERKLVEERLKESERIFEEAQQTANLGSWDFNIAADKPSWSKQMYILFGRDPLLGEPSWQEHKSSIHPDDWEALDAAVASVIPFRIEFRIVHPAKGTRWAWTISHTVSDNNNKVVKLHGIVQDITERKLAEEKIKESEAKFRNVVEEAIDIVYTVDLEGNFTYVNPAGEKLSGYSVEELTKMKYLDLIDPEYKQQVKRNFFKQYIERNAFSFSEYPIISKSGEIKWINQNTRLIIENNEAKGFFAISREVSELHRAETALKESEEKYRLIVENIGEGFGFVNGEEQFLLANKSAELIFGVGPDGLVGKNLDQFVSNDQFNMVKEETTIRKQGIQSVYELDIIRPNGEKRIIHVTAVPQKNKDGSFIGTYGIFRDITERKLAEETLRVSQQLIEGIINAIPVRIFWKDRNSIYLGCNKIFANDAGFSDPKDLIGKDDFQMGWHDQAELYRSGDRHVMESGIPILLNEEPQTTPEGNTIILLTNKIPLKNSKGEFYGILGTSMNVTERKAVEQEIKLKNEELSRVISEKDRFFSIIAHDLRGPFNGFLGLTQIMMEELDTLSREDLLRMAQGLEKSASNLFSLLENLLQWARMQQGLIPFNPIGVQLLTVFESCCPILFEQAQIKGVDITVDISADLSVYADINMLQTIIRNLVSNALKFTHKGGKVTISANTGDDNNVVVAIEDTGIGMSSEMVDNLFRLDVQTGRLGTNGESSSGLGLVLCKEFVEKQGEKIMVKSEEGKGSTFCFTISGNASSK